VFEFVNDHVKQKITSPAVTLVNWHGANVYANKIPCWGPFARFDSCLTAAAWGNDGGAGMTQQHTP